MKKYFAFAFFATGFVVTSFSTAFALGSFFEEHVAALKHLPCENVGGYSRLDVNPSSFTCTSGTWGEVSFRIKSNGGNAESIQLFWRDYPKNSFFEGANETVLPFFDFISQRYGKASESEIYEVLNKKARSKKAQYKVKHNGLMFEHKIESANTLNVMFNQHELLVYKTAK